MVQLVQDETEESAKKDAKWLESRGHIVEWYL